jgi:hypothetical protein
MAVAMYVFSLQSLYKTESAIFQLKFNHVKDYFFSVFWDIDSWQWTVFTLGDIGCFLRFVIGRDVRLCCYPSYFFDLISGPLVLGVRPNLKVDGVALFLGNTLSLNTMVSEPIVVSLLSWCVQVHVMYLILLISQSRKIKAAPLLQISAYEELLSLVLNYFWPIIWNVFKMEGLGYHNTH